MKESESGEEATNEIETEDESVHNKIKKAYHGSKRDKKIFAIIRVNLMRVTLHFTQHLSQIVSSDWEHPVKFYW